MKNKKFTYILLTLVGLIWGFFFYVLFNKSEVEVSNDFSFNEESSGVTDSVRLKPLAFNYSDPFLKRNIIGVGAQSFKIPASSVKKTNKYPSRSQVSKITVKWPHLEYGGTVNKTKGFLKVSNRQVLLKEGGIQDGVKLIKLFADSIKVGFKGEVKTIFKNK